MQDPLVVIVSVLQSADRCVIQRRVNIRNAQFPSCIAVDVDREALSAIYAKINHYICRERCSVAGQPWAEESLGSRVGGHNLIVVGCGWCQVVEDDGVGPSS